jgi:hypothetical protein
VFALLVLQANVGHVVVEWRVEQSSHKTKLVYPPTVAAARNKLFKLEIIVLKYLSNDVALLAVWA